MTLTDVYNLIEEYKTAGKGELKHVNFPIILPAGVIRDIIDGQESDRRLRARSDTKRGFAGFGYIHNDTEHQFISLSPEFLKDLAKIESLKDENKALKRAAISKFIKENK